jgi:GxxExxY protein
MYIEEFNRITNQIIASAIEVHRTLGPGLLESVYDICMTREMEIRGLLVERQLTLPVNYKGIDLGKEFIIDQLVEREIIVELKLIEGILPVHEAQLVTYLKLSGKKLGLLINFNVPVLKDGIRRKINGNLNHI